MKALTEYKHKVFEKCVESVSAQIESAQSEMKKLREMEGEETKSSAGDKYETGRAMLFLEKEKVSIRLSEAYKRQRALGQIRIENIHETVQLGSLVQTDKGNFFISVSLGKETIDGVEFFLISPVSPIGKALSGKKKGDTATFNKATYQVLDLV